MLRNILMSIGLLVAVLPYIGLPYDVTKWIWTFAGLFLMLLVFFAQHPRRRESVVVLEDEPISSDEPRELDVVRHEDTIRPEVHVERTVVTLHEERENATEPTLAEIDVTKVKRKRRKSQVAPELHETPSPEA